MSPGFGFLLFLAITLAFLGYAVATGYAAQRSRHIPAVLCAVVSLGITIYFAEQLGRLYDLEAAGWIYPVHLFFAKTTTALYLVPLVLGPCVIKRPELLPWHRLAAYLVLGMTVATAVTGTWMILVSERLPVG